MKNIYVNLILAALLAGGAGFYGGTVYQKTRPVTLGGRSSQFVRGQFPGGSGSNRPGGNQGMRPVSGVISAVDDSGVTVKLPDGSSKIIILTGMAKINKTESSDKSALVTGQNITVFGTSNSDGSIVAETVNVGGELFRLSSPSAAVK